MVFYIQVIRLVQAQYFLLVVSIIRTGMAIWFMGELRSTFNFSTSSMVVVLTAVIWQCYFANTLTSVKDFCISWASFTRRQQILSLTLGVPAVLCVPIFVANGLLDFAHGFPPNVPMRVFSSFPALLWAIPVTTNSAIGLFQAANEAKLKEIQKVLLVHLVTLTLYCAFLMNSEGETLVGSSGTAVFGMLGLAFAGFILQYMVTEPHTPDGLHNGIALDYTPTRVPHIHTRPAPTLQYQLTVDQVIQFMRTPYFLMLISVIRTVIAVVFIGQLGSSLNFIYRCIEFILTAIIWQCYFANTRVSICGFVQCWNSFTSKQQTVLLSLGVPTVLCAFYFVTNGVLEFTRLPHSVPMCVFNYLPAVLWTIPVVLNSALGLLPTARGAQMKDMQEVFIVHLVSLPLYCTFLMISEGDVLVGSNWTAVHSMLGVTLIGFFLQCIYMGPHKLPTCAPESGEQNRSHSEIVVSAPMQRDSAGHEFVTQPLSNPPKLSDKDDIVVRTDALVSPRYVPIDVHRP